MEVTWALIKKIAIQTSTAINFIEKTSSYDVWVVDYGQLFYCTLFKESSNTTDLIDFENNYKTKPPIDIIGNFYKIVAANSIETCPGFVVPNNNTYVLSRFRANGADPSSYVALIWDYEGTEEKIICSTRGDVDLFFDTLIESEHLVGNGSKKLNIVITNNNDTASPAIGGSFELIKVN